MSPIEYFKEVNSAWKVTICLIIFCLWPLSSYLIFHYQTTLFLTLEMMKLTLLSAAMSTPLLIINTGITFMLNKTSNRNPTAPPDGKLISGTVLFGTAVTAFIFSLAACMTLTHLAYHFLILLMAFMELAYLIIVVFNALKKSV